jgi:hypothetical protein
MKKNILLLIFLLIPLLRVYSQDSTAIQYKDYSKISAQYITNGIVTCDSAIAYPRPLICLFRGYVISNYDELSTADVYMTNVVTNETIHDYSNDYGQFNFRLPPGTYSLRISHIDYNDLCIDKIVLSGGEKRIIKLLINDLPQNK